MSRPGLEVVLRRLLRATSPNDVSEILRDIGDSAESELHEPLGDTGLFWHPVGGDASNLSAINLATKPGRSLAERVTNAIDALLELRARKLRSDLPRNPRQAAEKWFGRPQTGPDRGLFTWDFSPAHQDRQIHVTLLNSGQEEAPTVDVLDAGVGLTAAEFPQSILSLRGGNKIRKFHLIGAFGQGGSSTLAFADFTVYASRHADDPGSVAFTVVRVLRLSDDYKEDCYAYLALRDSQGQLLVPSVRMSQNELDIYSVHGVKAPKWLHGTLVRHIAFKLPGLAGGLQAVPGNLYHFLHASLFDPILPFRLLDLRRSGRERNELVSGSRNRLMKYTTKTQDEEDEDSAGELRHYRPMEFIVPHGETAPSIGVEYWVVLNWRKTKSKTNDQARILRPRSNELFVQSNHPVVGSLNGQNQGELTSGLFKRLNLGMVGRHIVIHVDASQAPSHVRRELFSSTREGFKDGPVLSAIENVLATMLTEDEELAHVERELAERIVQRENQRTEDEVKRQITKLLMDAGVEVREEGPAAEKGGGEATHVAEKKRPPYKKRDPLPTLPFPGVTKWKMVVPDDELVIRVGDYETVLVETNADAEFDRRGLLAIRAEPHLLELGTKAPLSGGRVRWRMRTVEGAKEGQQGRLVATITRPDGSQLTAERPFRIMARLLEPGKKTRGQVPPFDVFPIDPSKDEDRELWGQLWPHLADATDPEKIASVAYKTTTLAGKRVVYFNVLFTPFRRQEDLFLLKGKQLAEMFRVQYKIWIGYHALLQEADSADERAESLDSELIEQTLLEETLRVARMQSKQAAQFVEVKRQAIRDAETATESD